jgi:hypothetical protein
MAFEGAAEGRGMLERSEIASRFSFRERSS